MIKKKRGGGSNILDRTYARGGGHSDANCVQQGGWWGLKIGKNAYVINGRPLIPVPFIR